MKLLYFIGYGKWGSTKQLGQSKIEELEYSKSIHVGLNNIHLFFT